MIVPQSEGRDSIALTTSGIYANYCRVRPCGGRHTSFILSEAMGPLSLFGRCATSARWDPRAKHTAANREFCPLGSGFAGGSGGVRSHGDRKAERPH